MNRSLFAVIFALCGFIAGLMLTGRMRTVDESAAAAAQPAPAAGQVAGRPASVPAALPDLSGVAARTVSSVMNISSLQVVRAPNSPLAADPLFQYFFGNREDVFGYRNRVSQSLGSGVVVSSDGYILTNSHVVGDARAEVSVGMPDKREMRAKIIGVDEATDIALLKIEARGLPVLPWADSSKLKVAEWVLAIGNPFQLNQTVTLGIVSALGRSLEGRLAMYEDFIQTDAAINPGNSGGALVNAQGELVGINTAIFSETGGYQGIGFAVPSNLARHVMDDLMKFGEVQRGTMPGVVISSLNAQLAEQLEAPDTRGALVTEMSRRSDAWEAGLRPGDIIVAFNSRQVGDASQFQRMLSDSKVGTTARVEILRQGRKLDLSIPITRARRSR